MYACAHGYSVRWHGGDAPTHYEPVLQIAPPSDPVLILRESRVCDLFPYLPYWCFAPDVHHGRHFLPLIETPHKVVHGFVCSILVFLSVGCKSGH